MSRFSQLTRGSAVVLVTAVTGCSVVSPDFQGLGMAQVSRFAFAPDHALREAAQHDWWRELEDPLLDRIIARALQQNLDLKAAQSRLREAEALLGTVGLRSQLTGDATFRADATLDDKGETDTSASAALQPSFVVDLFGRQRREQEAALARTAAAAFDRPTIQLALLLEIATAYVQLRALEAELRVRQGSLSAQQRIVDVLDARLEEGEATRIEQRRAQAETALTRAELPPIRAARDTAALRLATLLSEPPERILEELRSGTARQPVPPSNIDPGVPAALLKNRPDIRRAEADYAAAVAEIGVAEAALYPSLRIGGTIRVAADSSLGLSPVLTIPVLNRGVLKARTDAAIERARQAQIAWQQAVLNATEEVQVALVQLHRSDQHLRLMHEAVEAADAAVALTREAFELEGANLDQILEAELNAAAARVRMISARQSYAENWARLNVALGMGWQTDSEGS